MKIQGKMEWFIYFLGRNKNLEYKFIKDEEIIEFVEKNLHLSYSTEKEVGEFFRELKTIKKIEFKEFIKGKEFEFKNNKKQDTSKFLKIIRDYKYPIMNKSMNKVKGLVSSIKSKTIKVSYPENLEGDSFELNIKIKSVDDVEKMMQHLEKRKDEMKNLITAIKKGG